MCTFLGLFLMILLLYVSRASQLQIAEIQKKLEVLPSVELELEALRRQKPSWQSDSVDAQKQSSPGLWQWVTGST